MRHQSSRGARGQGGAPKLTRKGHHRSRALRVLMISKALVVGAYQRKLEEIARYPDVELTAVVPTAWGGQRLRAGLPATATVRSSSRSASTATSTCSTSRASAESCASYGPTSSTSTRSRTTSRLRWRPARRSRVRRAAALLHLAEPAPALPAAVLLVRAVRVLRVAPRHRRQRRSCRGAAGARATAGRPVIPQFGVDPDLFSPAPACGAEQRPFTIGDLGRLTPEKGIDLLLDAAAASRGLAAALRRERADCASRWPARPRRLGIADRVTFEAAVRRSRCRDKCTGLTCWPCLSLTRPQLERAVRAGAPEAMACGVAVVGSDSGEIPNVIGDRRADRPGGRRRGALPIALRSPRRRCRSSREHWRTRSRACAGPLHAGRGRAPDRRGLPAGGSRS